MLSRKLNELIYLNILLWQIFIKLDFFKTSFSSVDFEFIFFEWLHKNLKQKKINEIVWILRGNPVEKQFSYLEKKKSCWSVFK